MPFNTSYTWSKAQILQRYGFNKPQEWIDQAGQVGNVQHALKGNVNFEIAGRPRPPVRREHARLSSTRSSAAGRSTRVARIQTGETLDFGNVRLVGMSEKDLQQLIKVQQGPSGQMFILPDDILQNTVKAFSVSATSASGYGARRRADRPLLRAGQRARLHRDRARLRRLRTAQRHRQRTAAWARLDLGISKKFPEVKALTFEFRAEMLNALNQPYFNPASAGGTPLGFTTTSTGPGRARGDQRDADREHDGGHQRRQLPPHDAARRQPVAHRPARVARSLVTKARVPKVPEGCLRCLGCYAKEDAWGRRRLQAFLIFRCRRDGGRRLAATSRCA